MRLEEAVQLYREDRAASLKAWQKRKRAAPDSPEARIAAAEADLVDFQSKNTIEKLVVVDKATGEVLHSQTGDETMVSSHWLPPAGVSVVDMHTHPDASSFSDADWRRFSWSHIDEARVVNNRGTVILKKEAGWNAIHHYNRTPAKIYDRWNAISDEEFNKVDWDSMSIDAGTMKVIDGTNHRMAKEFGVSFTLRSK